MLRKKRKPAPENSPVDTIIGSKTAVEGNIIAEGVVRVDGKIKGDIKVNGDLIIGTDASIIGNIHSVSVFLAGSIEGNVTAKEQLKLTETGKLYGDITVKTFIAEEGAVFEGSCNMTESHKEDGGSLSPRRRSYIKNYKRTSLLDEIDVEDEAK